MLEEGVQPDFFVLDTSDANEFHLKVKSSAMMEGKYQFLTKYLEIC